MPAATRALPSINTTDVRAASSSASRSRDSGPYTATEAYAAASAAYYERPQSHTTTYSFDSQHQPYDVYTQQQNGPNYDGRTPRLQGGHSQLSAVEEQSYDGLPYDAPHSSHARRQPVGQRSRRAAESSESAEPGNAGPPTLIYDPDYVIAMHDYVPGAGNATCLAFRAGEVIHVLNRDSTGWWDGELEGRRGWFPSNYISTDAAAFAAAAELAGFAVAGVEPIGHHSRGVSEHEPVASGSGASSSRPRVSA